MKRENNKLTDVEWTTCWMSVRYAMNRQTIAASSLPRELIMAYGRRWTIGQMTTLYRDLKQHYDDFGQFGDKTIDTPTWIKFMNFLNYKDYYTAVFKSDEGREYIMFKDGDKHIPLIEYMKNPFINTYVGEEPIATKAIFEPFETLNDLIQ